jgi:hypothetical protein
MGIDPADPHPLRKAGKSPLHAQLVQSRIAELKSRITTGGLRECLIRGMLYVGMARGGADERGFEAVRRMRSAQDGMRRLSLAEFKALVREQYFMLLIDEEATLAAIPDLLPEDGNLRRKSFAALTELLRARGEIVGEAAIRFERVARLFDVDPAAVVAPRSYAAAAQRAKAS